MGGLDLVQSLVATVGSGAGEDGLQSRDGAVAWLRVAGLLQDGAGLTNSEHAALIRLRDAVRDFVHGRDRADASTRLTRALADGRLVLTVEPSGSTRLATAARSSYPNIVAAIAVAISESDGAWLRS
jgi:hypothetical protein